MAAMNVEASAILDRIALRLQGVGITFNLNPHWNWREPRRIASACLGCGLSVELWCVYAEAGGGTSFEYEFFHVCLACQSILHRSEHGGSVGYEDPARCPFCGYRWE